MIERTEDEDEVIHRKSGGMDTPEDALHLVEWLSRTLCDECQDSFGRGIHVDVEVRVRPINSYGDDNE